MVPRWRDDVLFVQASIYDFQPWVTSGAIEPPANPLVISQPCLRFMDIGEVGVSLRHLTEFEMLAHHAFNGPGHEVYFKDRTVELCHDLFTGSLGANSSAITYKEEVWEGGGDMGPSLSVGLEGLEIATLVFMQYSKQGDVIKPLPLRIVDTGYGLERIVWESQGTPTIYEAVFHDVLQELPSDFSLREAAMLVDHARSLTLMLTDGVVPSNVKEGYLARLLLRRMIRVLDHHPGRITLEDLLHTMVRHVAKSFPEVGAAEKEIFDVLTVEQGRFRETVERGRTYVRKLEARLADDGKQVGVPELLELYDSMGITPDVAAEELKHPPAIPDDFFAQVARLHERPESAAHSDSGGSPSEPLPELPQDVPPTEVLYHLDPYTTRFRAKVVWAHGPWAVLDRTYFYPTGGGQITDTGMLGGIPVVEVSRKGPHVLHRLGSATGFTAKAGEEVEGHIDEGRRRQLMQHHTATHLLNGALRQVLGNHVWQAGAYKGTDGARLDITHFQGLTDEETSEVERIANRVVREDRPVKSYFSPRSEAEARFGFTLYQGGAVPGKSLRIIEINGFDIEACGGTHCTHTSEVGLVKIFSTERIQDGMVRVNFAAGDRSLELLQGHERILRELSRKLAVPAEGLPAALDGVTERVRELEKSVRKGEAVGVKAFATQLLGDGTRTLALPGGFRVVRVLLPPGSADLKDLARELTRDPKVVALLASSDGPRGMLFFASGSPDRYPAMSALVAARESWAGKGGGNPSAATATGPSGPELEKALDAALSFFRNLHPA